MLLLSLTGIDFINDHLLRQESFLPTDTASQAQSSTEDDEDDFFFQETLTVASELELFLESHDTDLSIYNKLPNLCGVKHPCPCQCCMRKSF